MPQTYGALCALAEQHGVAMTEQVRSLMRAVEKVALRAQADARPTMWVALTDEDRKAAFESLPDMLEGFLKKWGWLNFAKEIERRCKEKNANFVREAITHPEASAPGLSEREIADTVNKVRDIAREFHATQQLRERIARVLVPILTRASAATGSPSARIEELRKGLFEARDALVYAAGLEPHRYQPNDRIYFLNMIESANAVLSGASAATVGEAFVPALLTDGPACIAPEKRPAYRAGWNDARTAVLNHQAAQQQTSQGASHEWDASGERCLKCGDKDWFAGSTCSAKAAQQQAEPSASAEIACSSCGLTMGDSKALAAMKQVEPGADERVAVDPMTQALPFAILADEMKALRRFHECATDDEGYDVSKGMMKRLSEIGLVRRVTSNIYEHTNFGLAVLNGDFAAQSGQRAGVAEPEGWREFITEVAQQKPEKPDYWSPCGQCQHNADRAQDLIAAAPTQQQEGGDA